MCLRVHAGVRGGRGRGVAPAPHGLHFIKAFFDVSPIPSHTNQCARTQVFDVDAVEVWLLRPPEEEEEGAAAGGAAGRHGTVLQARAQDREIFAAMGVNVNHSEGIGRDAPPEDAL